MLVKDFFSSSKKYYLALGHIISLEDLEAELDTFLRPTKREPGTLVL